MKEAMWAVFVINTIRIFLRWFGTSCAISSYDWTLLMQAICHLMVLPGHKCLILIARQPVERPEPAQGPSRLLEINPNIDSDFNGDTKGGQQETGTQKNWFAWTLPLLWTRDEHAPPPRLSNERPIRYSQHVLLLRSVDPQHGTPEIYLPSNTHKSGCLK